MRVRSSFVSGRGVRSEARLKRAGRVMSRAIVRELQAKRARAGTSLAFFCEKQACSRSFSLS